MHILVGLGNPGDRYDLTRHNIGAELLRHLQIQEGFSEWDTDKWAKAEISRGLIGDKEVLLMLPQVYMNNSGQSLSYLINKLGSFENVIVAHDDLDIPVGSFKISHGKNSGGHNGVESIIGVMKTNQFIRLRLGIAPNNEEGQGRVGIQENTAKFVLKNFSPKEIDIMEQAIDKASVALKMIILEGRMAAMEKFN